MKAGADSPKSRYPVGRAYRSTSRAIRLRTASIEESGATSEHWTELDQGGQFAAFEQPDLFVNEVRNFFSPVR